MNKKTRLIQYFEPVPYENVTGNELEVYGSYYTVPDKGVTDILKDGSTVFKYDFGTQEIILLDISGNEVIRKKVPLESFMNRQWAWLNLAKREARLILNLDEESNERVEAVCEEANVRKIYYGYIDEDGDVIDMRDSVEGGIGVRITDVDSMFEELEGSYEVTDDGDIYQIFEEALPKTSAPEEGKVYWDKKHETAYYVVAVYPDQNDAKKQVSYWNDEGTRLTCSIEDFKKKMVPSKDVDDYDIFEEIESDEGFDISEDMHEENINETAGLTVDKKATNGKAFTVEINGKKYSYYPTEESGLTAKELGQKYASIAKYSQGKALAWLKKNATTKDSYRKSKEIPGQTSLF